jgi:hypothetical protein
MDRSTQFFSFTIVSEMRRNSAKVLVADAGNGGKTIIISSPFSSFRTMLALKN